MKHLRNVKWLVSFRHAYEGIKYALATERNMKFHFLAAFLVLLAALFLGLNKLEILFILLAVTLIIVTELINTAIEKTVDLAMTEYHALAKIAKDVAAASVLVSSVFAIWVAVIVFYEPIDRLFHYAYPEPEALGPGQIWVLFSVTLLAVIVIETRFSDKGKWVKPSIFTAITFATSTFIALYVKVTFIALLTFTMSSFIVFILHDKQDRPFPSLILGAVIGIVVSIFVWMIMYFY